LKKPTEGLHLKNPVHENHKQDWSQGLALVESKIELKNNDYNMPVPRGCGNRTIKGTLTPAVSVGGKKCEML